MNKLVGVPNVEYLLEYISATNPYVITINLYYKLLPAKWAFLCPLAKGFGLCPRPFLGLRTNSVKICIFFTAIELFLIIFSCPGKFKNTLKKISCIFFIFFWQYSYFLQF